MVNTVGSLPQNYIGASIGISYYENSSEKRKYSAFNVIYNVTFNNSANGGAILVTDPNDFVNKGPYYYSGERRAMSLFGKNELYAPFAMMDFTGEITVYGKSDNSWMEIGTVTYGFSYKDGILVPKNPSISYVNGNGK